MGFLSAVFLTPIFQPLYRRPPATLLAPRGGGGWCSQRERTASHPFLSIRPLAPPCRGWDATATPTLRNHLYLVDVTTYHPLSSFDGGGFPRVRNGGGGQGGGLVVTREPRDVGCTTGSRRKRNRKGWGEEEKKKKDGKKNNEMNIARPGFQAWKGKKGGGGGIVELL